MYQFDHDIPKYRVGRPGIIRRNHGEIRVGDARPERDRQRLDVGIVRIAISSIKSSFMVRRFITTVENEDN